MALISCPECGRENVSDSAETCPSCGFNINSHFQKAKKEIDKELRIKRIEEEKKEIENQKINSIPKPNKPRYSIIAAICGILCLILGGYPLFTSTEDSISYSLSHGDGHPVVQGLILFIGGIIVLGFGYYFYKIKLKDYQLAERDFKSYQIKKVKESDAQRLQQNTSNIVCCPTCSSTNVEKISGASKVGKAVVFGVFAVGSINKTFHCKNCGYRW